MGSKNIWMLDWCIHVKLDGKLYIVNKLSDLDKIQIIICLVHVSHAKCVEPD